MDHHRLLYRTFPNLSQVGPDRREELAGGQVLVPLSLLDHGTV